MSLADAGFLRTARRLKCFFSSRLPEMVRCFSGLFPDEAKLIGFVNQSVQGFFSRIAHLYTAVLSIYQLDLFISMVIFPFALFFGEFLVPVMSALMRVSIGKSSASIRTALTKDSTFQILSNSTC